MSGVINASLTINARARDPTDILRLVHRANF